MTNSRFYPPPHMDHCTSSQDCPAWDVSLGPRQLRLLCWLPGNSQCQAREHGYERGLPAGTATLLPSLSPSSLSLPLQGPPRLGGAQKPAGSAVISTWPRTWLLGRPCLLPANMTLLWWSCFESRSVIASSTKYWCINRVINNCTRKRSLPPGVPQHLGPRMIPWAAPAGGGVPPAPCWY